MKRIEIKIYAIKISFLFQKQTKAGINCYKLVRPQNFPIFIAVIDGITTKVASFLLLTIAFVSTEKQHLISQMTRFLDYHTQRFTSRWAIFVMDMVVVSGSFILATLIRFNFELTYVDFNLFKYHLLVVVTVRSLLLYLSKTHCGIIRHTTIEDALRIFKSISLSTAALLVLSTVAGNMHIAPIDTVIEFFHIPISIILIDHLIVLFSLLLIRLSIKSAYDFLLVKAANMHKRRVIIYGAGSLGIMTKNTLLQDKKKNTHVLVFIDDNPQKTGKTIEGVEVVSKEKAITKYLGNQEAIMELEVIFAINAINGFNKNQIIDEFLELGVQMKIVPPIETWIDGQLQANQIQDVKIEDLLNREEIKLNNSEIRENLMGKTIIISGAAGSIGSEIVRQVIHYRPDTLILLDQSESALYDLETELKRLPSIGNKVNLHIEVCDITSKNRVEKIFKRFQPDTVFHAAAYKHVPLMEGNPYQAFHINVLGTKVVADLSKAYKVEKFLFISTDKAVNPTNVMGATKRMAEMYVQSLNHSPDNTTRYIVTRFGNVLGSNGSVIPLFKKQIEKGGPVTVTHPEVIRYFMTIPEACQLVLEAYTMGKGGEIFVFDMGEPVKIKDLAQKMIRLSGFEPDVDIHINYVGLRPGEKLYEELLGHGEDEQPTHHSKIKIATLEVIDYKQLNSDLQTAARALEHLSDLEIVAFLKQHVTEYISNNSTFKQLDTKKVLI